MPYVNIKITREGNVTPEQKRQLIEGATNLLHDVLGKNKADDLAEESLGHRMQRWYGLQNEPGSAGHEGAGIRCGYCGQRLAGSSQLL